MLLLLEENGILYCLEWSNSREIDPPFQKWNVLLLPLVPTQVFPILRKIPGQGCLRLTRCVPNRNEQFWQQVGSFVQMETLGHFM